MERFTVEVGRVLRRARKTCGLTLRDLLRTSHGRFKPSSVAGYERGERAISLERFCELAEFYGVSADRLLADVLQNLAPETRVELMIDLDKLTLVVDEEGTRLAEFVEDIQVRRGDRSTRVITLRSGDLESMALGAHVKPDALITKLAPALRTTND